MSGTNTFHQQLNRIMKCIGELVLLAGLLTLGPAVHAQDKPYIESVLTSWSAPTVSVIVTADSAELAAEAVEQVGGQVTSDLWLIDAVGAVIATDQVDVLATNALIHSIVHNKGVASAVAPTQNDTTTGSAYQWDGWVSDRRRYNHTHALSGDMWGAPVTLPDGSVFALIEKGDFLIMNQDGTLRASGTLPGKPYRMEQAVDTDGTIFVPGETRLGALDPANGSTLWYREAISKYKGGIAVDSNAVYVGTDRYQLLAFDKSDGSDLWQHSRSETTGPLLSSPVVGPDGAIYYLTENGYLFALDPSDGSQQWSYQATLDSGDHYYETPQIDDAGVIYFASDKGHIYAINPDGTLKYDFTISGKVSAPITVAGDGSLYIPEENGRLLAYDADGNQLFDVEHSTLSLHFRTQPILSLDESRVYVASKDKKLLAFAATTGSILWEHTTTGDLLASPVVAPNDNIHLGDKQGVYEIITPEGLVVYRYGGFSEFRVSPTLSDDGSVFFHDNKARIVVLNRLPSEHDENMPHVEATNDPNVYKVANPMSIDMGADVAHDNDVTGDGVAVAVVDSGVYFDANTQATLGAVVEQHFLGQADFVGSLNCADTMTTTAGGSPSDCFTDHTNSYDGYGHGSHVAGIIWNNVTDYYTGVALGIAPDAKVLSIRVLGDDGIGTYEDVIEGIQYVVDNQNTFSIDVMNLSLSAYATTPYFVDPINQAVEEAWAAGIVVVAAAGNEGPEAETITVPGNNPYVITAGAVDSNKTPGYWADDTLPTWSGNGPTLDGFIKPDVIVPGGNVVSYMYNDGDPDPATSDSPQLVLEHPDYSVTGSMFRMNGTSMATAVASGVVALILEEHSNLTPDQVKFRLMYSARAATDNGDFAFSPLQQGMGRIWAPDAVFDDSIPADSANVGMNINDDLAHGWQLHDENGDPVYDENGDPVLDKNELAYHYSGPVFRILSDDGQYYLYYAEEENGGPVSALGAVNVNDMMWIDRDTMQSLDPSFDNGQLSWGNGYVWAGGVYNWAGGVYNWAGGVYNWAGGVYNWAGGVYNWAGGVYNWAGGVYNWAGGVYNWAGNTQWANGIDGQTADATATTWVED